MRRRDESSQSEALRLLLRARGDDVKDNGGPSALSCIRADQLSQSSLYFWKGNKHVLCVKIHWWENEDEASIVAVHAIQSSKGEQRAPALGLESRGGTHSIQPGKKA